MELMEQLLTVYDLTPLIGLRVHGKYDYNEYEGVITAITGGGLLIKQDGYSDGWNCSLIGIDPIQFGGDCSDGTLEILNMPVLQKFKKRRSKWVPLTVENQVVGAIISNVKARKQYKGSFKITQVLPDRIEMIKIGYPRKYTIYQFNGKYLMDHGTMFIDMNNLPKQPKFHCIQCHKPQARRRKALCKPCSLIPF